MCYMDGFIIENAQENDFNNFCIKKKDGYSLYFNISYNKPRQTYNINFQIPFF